MNGYERERTVQSLQNGRLVDQKDARDQADECVLEFECTVLV